MPGRTKAAGVKHIAYTSWIALSNADTSGLSADHSKTEEVFKESGVAYRFLRNSIYQETLLPAASKMLAGHWQVGFPGAAR